MIEFLKEYWAFLKERKKFFLIPLILVLLGISALVYFSTSSSVSPFIYTLF